MNQGISQEFEFADPAALAPADELQAGHQPISAPRRMSYACEQAFERCSGLGLACVVIHDGGMVRSNTTLSNDALAKLITELAGRSPGLADVALDGGSTQFAAASVAAGTWLAVTVAIPASDCAVDFEGQIEQTALARQNRVDMAALSLQRMLVECGSESNHSAMMGEFASRLARAHEETASVFRIMRLMNRREHVSEQLELTCNAILQAIPFAWVACVFHRSEVVTEEMRGRIFLAGQLPGDEPAIINLITQFGESIVQDGWTRVGAPGACPLATLVGSEVVYDPITHDDQVIGLLIAGNNCGVDGKVVSRDLQFIDACSDFLGVYHENTARINEQRSMSLGVLQALVAAIDAKDPYTRGHSERVAELSRLIARGLGMKEEQAERVHIAGLVHDVGKIGVPDWVLRKPGKLSDDEFRLIKLHPETGHRILKDVPLLSDTLPGVLHHHERFDGGGYPFGLAGHEISLLGRIVGLADSFDAMCSKRAYRTGLSREAALAEVTRCAGSQYDPELVSIFMTLDLSTYDQLLESEVPQTAEDRPAEMYAEQVRPAA